ncbi:hypothetical protein RFI_02926 [Reticulomyxa filosa]|uniref:Uncharacterized protein n=1 Tax=Reticulomyxa filosa TaxID=46433 RepID=X6P7S3_RETFI|nr:hypothetical protein RFI_02926 [Reticulomyxa filosa]|eukprot:ETO34168.1 hypothetical protein RFI_02926 [Reticulomyxa filosa]
MNLLFVTGSYLWTTASRIDLLDNNAVLSLSVFDGTSDALNGNSAVDITATNWGYDNINMSSGYDVTSNNNVYTQELYTLPKLSDVQQIFHDICYGVEFVVFIFFHLDWCFGFESFVDDTILGKGGQSKLQTDARILHCIYNICIYVYVCCVSTVVAMVLRLRIDRQFENSIAKLRIAICDILEQEPDIGRGGK